MKAYLNWSGGKDSSLALYHSLQDASISVAALFTSVNAVHNRISMHGVRRELLKQQVQSINLPLYTAELPEQPSMIDYELEMERKVAVMKAQGFGTAIFGDIFLDDLKKYREEQLANMGITCTFPLWKRDTKELMQEFLNLGFKAIIVCINSNHLDKSFCGRIIDHSFVNDLPDHVDVCGENGEYHSFVFDGPIFREPVAFQKGEIVFKEYATPKNEKDQCFSAAPQKPSGFYFLDLLPVSNSSTVSLSG